MSGSPPPHPSQFPPSPIGYSRPRRTRNPPDMYGDWVSDFGIPRRGRQRSGVRGGLDQEGNFLPDLILSSGDEDSDSDEDSEPGGEGDHMAVQGGASPPMVAPFLEDDGGAASSLDADGLAPALSSPTPSLPSPPHTLLTTVSSTSNSLSSNSALSQQLNQVREEIQAEERKGTTTTSPSSRLL